MDKLVADVVKQNAQLLNKPYLDDFYNTIGKWNRGQVTEFLRSMGVEPITRVMEILPCLYRKNDIEKITIPTTISIIGDNAFEGCDELTSVDIPDNILTIFDYAFADCMRLSTVKFNPTSKCAFIGHNAFAKTNLSKIVVPGSVKAIGPGAFYWCSNLKEAIFLEGVEDFGGTTFVECRNLSYVSLPRTLKSFGLYTFQNCKKLDKLYYAGTKDEFASVMKNFSSNWAYQSALDKVICSDGVLDLDDRLKITI